jgi:opacity protein-like surface antigen
MKKFTLVVILILVVGMFSLVSFSTVFALDLKGKFGLTGQGGVAIPFGDFADKEKLAAKTGFGFGGGAEYFVTNNIAIGGTFRYDKHDIDPGSEDGEVSASWKITNFGAYFKYAFPTQSKIVPYLRLDAGIYKPKGTFSAEGLEASVSFSSKLGIGGGGGVMYEVSKNVMLGGEVLFHDAMTKEAEATVGGMDVKLDSDIQYINIFAGVTFLVGGTK